MKREIDNVTYTYTLLIIQCLWNNYSSTQKINEAKVNNKRNKTHTRVFDTHDEGLWAESQTPSEFKSKSDKKGGKEVLEIWKFKKHACMLPLTLTYKGSDVPREPFFGYKFGKAK